MPVKSCMAVALHSLGCSIEDRSSWAVGTLSGKERWENGSVSSACTHAEESRKAATGAAVAPRPSSCLRGHVLQAERFVDPQGGLGSVQRVEVHASHPLIDQVADLFGRPVDAHPLDILVV